MFVFYYERTAALLWVTHQLLYYWLLTLSVDALQRISAPWKIQEQNKLHKVIVATSVAWKQEDICQIEATVRLLKKKVRIAVIVRYYSFLVFVQMIV